MIRIGIFTFLLPFLAITTGYPQSAIQPLDAELRNYNYFAPCQYITLNIQEHSYRMAYMDIKPAKPNGKTILLLHGKNFNGNYWQQTATTLSQNGYRVIIPDQLGFGKSSKPADIQYSFHLLARNTKQLLDSLGVTQVTILGHSMGGMLATRFALLYPATTHRLILVSPIGLEDYKVYTPYKTPDERFATEMQQTPEKIKAYQQKNYFGGNWKQEYDKLLEVPTGWLMHRDYPVIARSSALTYDMIFTQPVVYEFSNLKMPTLLIVGLKDKTAIGKELVSTDTAAMMGDYTKLGKTTAKKNSRIELKELNTGHLPHIENFDAFIKPLLAFITR